MAAVSMRAGWIENLKNSLYPVFTTLTILFLWQGIVLVFGVPDYVLPGPVSIILELVRLSRLLLYHAYVTMYETVIGLALAIVFALVLSVFIVWHKSVEKSVWPILVFLHTTPKIAIAPLFIVWFGFGVLPKIIISFWLAYFPITIATITGLRDVEPEMIDLSTSMSCTTLQTFIKVRIPSSLPHFFSGLKLGSIVALLGAIVGEYVGADEGLGYIIDMSVHNVDVKMLFADVIVLTMLGRVIYWSVCLAERYTIPWHVAMRTEDQKMFSA
jgi:NitT/TauT family transport system permease protein